MPAALGKVMRRRSSVGKLSEGGGGGLSAEVVKVLDEAEDVEAGMRQLRLLDPAAYYLHGQHIRTMLIDRISADVARVGTPAAQAQLSTLEAKAIEGQLRQLCHLHKEGLISDDVLREQQQKAAMHICASSALRTRLHH